jgi:hypothetical protein
MKLSKSKLNEYITLYLNDVEDYGNSSEYIIAESTLKPIKSLIVETKSNAMGILLESLKNANEPSRVVIEDFILYIKNI